MHASSAGNTSKQHKKWLLRSWGYRCQLLIETLVILWLLSITQSLLHGIPSHFSEWQDIIQWAEIAWFIPTPLAIVTWISWLFFTQAVYPDPVAIKVPFISLDQESSALPLLKPVRLVFRFVTRGENVDVLSQSVLAVHKAFASYPSIYGPYRVEIVSDRVLSLPTVTKSYTSVYVVPQDYVTPYRSRFKARALTYLQEETDPQPEDWHIYLDEESTIDEVFLAGIYHFVSQSVARMGLPNWRCRGIIGQGTIIYHGGHWFFRGADAIRTAGDLGHFRLQYSLGIPLSGMHGSFIVVRATDGVHLSFDVGPRNSITEDTAWALRAWVKGFRFRWVHGYLYEQPPQRVRDFMKQRSRWLIGVRLVLRDKTLPWRYRGCLAVYVCLWNLTPVPLALAICTVFTSTVTFPWIHIAANFVWAVTFLSYLQGAYVQARRTAHFVTKRKPSLFQIIKMYILSCLLSLSKFFVVVSSAFFGVIVPLTVVALPG